MSHTSSSVMISLSAVNQDAQENWKRYSGIKVVSIKNRQQESTLFGKREDMEAFLTATGNEIAIRFLIQN